MIAVSTKQLTELKHVWLSTSGVEYRFTWDAWLGCYAFGQSIIEDGDSYLECFTPLSTVMCTVQNNVVLAVHIQGNTYHLQQ